MSRTGSRICARPYCSKVAAATLSYAYESGSVWLDDLTVDSHPMVHDLCELHADAVTVPVIAWGLGLDRMAMVALGIHDIRELFTDNLDLIRSTKGAL